MTTPSRRHDIRKRRTRKHKITILRRRYKAAGTDAERSTILAKLARLSPKMTMKEFTREGKTTLA